MNNSSVIWEAALSISQHSLSPTVEQALNPSCWLLSMEIKMQCRLLIQSYYFTRCRKVKLLPGAKRPQLSDPEAIILPTQSNSHTCVLHLRFVQLIWSSSLLFWADSCPFTSGIISQSSKTHAVSQSMPLHILQSYAVFLSIIVSLKLSLTHGF